jgi:hypothetical protein
LRGFWQLQRLEHYAYWPVLIGIGLGLALDEATVRTWRWVPSFVESVLTLIPVVDAFWRVSPFPTVAQFLPALLWTVSLILGPFAALTVKHLRMPAMYLPLSAPRFWGALLVFGGVIVLLAVGGPAVTEDKLTRTRFPWGLILHVTQHQWFMGLLGGLAAGAVCVCWAGICLVVIRRFVLRSY